MRRALVMIVGIGMATHLPARDVPSDLTRVAVDPGHCSAGDGTVPLPTTGEVQLRAFTPAASLI